MSQVLTPAMTQPADDPGARVGAPGSRRGELVLHPRVVMRIAQRSAQLHAACPVEPSVHVRESSPDHLELEISLVLPYPDAPLVPALNRLRAQIAADLEHQTSRPVRRLDLNVERFTLAAGTGRRVE